MPERVSETAYFQAGGGIVEFMSHEVSGEIVPAVAIEGFGVYELFYSRFKPEIGLSVLKRGLNIAKQRGFIAEDMA